MDDTGVSWAIDVLGELSHNIIICFAQWNFQIVNF